MKKKPVIVESRSGKKIRLLRPNERSKKFAIELKENKHYTNFNQVKVDKRGKPLSLTDTQKAYRSGYLQARKDNAKCYNALNKFNNRDFMAPVVYVE